MKKLIQALTLAACVIPFTLPASAKAGGAKERVQVNNKSTQQQFVNMCLVQRDARAKKDTTIECHPSFAMSTVFFNEVDIDATERSGNEIVVQAISKDRVFSEFTVHSKNTRLQLTFQNLLTVDW